MNGRISKLFRQVFDNPLDRRSFRKAYTKSSKDQQSEARRIARKIKAARSQGHTVKKFNVNPNTHIIEEIQAGKDLEES